MEAKSLFIETDEVVLHAMDWGNNGPLLIVMHGGQRTSRSWDEVARGLSKDHWVITLDSRGQGESSAPTRGYSQIDRVRDLYKFCDALGLPPAIALGHSGGAATVLLSSLQNPHRFTKVFAIEPMLLQTHDQGNMLSERMAQTRRVWASESDLRETLANHPATRKWHPNVLEDVINHETWDLPDGSIEMKWSQNIYNPQDRSQDNYDFIDIAPKFEVPIFLMYGTESGYDKDNAAKFVSQLKMGEIQEVKGASHNVYMDNPAVVEAAVRRFVGDENKHMEPLTPIPKT
ncbi:MAG: alpha/beta hydrolase [SAR202 cluster bacterium]|nr:alpha/beta hydrolase [SAR202 cluster bacterium]|tara:strand:- start:1059 stop:1922 length:864 start_codon:yes stop_codon:yes gene_type:complete